MIGPTKQSSIDPMSEITRRTILESLKNIGPKTAIGIADAAALREIGPVEAWRRLKAAASHETPLVGLSALYGAFIDVHWNGLPAEVEAALRDKARARSRG